MWKSPAVEEPAYLASGSCATRNLALGFLIGVLCARVCVGIVRIVPLAVDSLLARRRPGSQLHGPGKPSMASGSTMTGVTSIDFYPSYIVVKTKTGAGHTFFAERTTKFEMDLARQERHGPVGPVRSLSSPGRDIRPCSCRPGRPRSGRGARAPG